MRTSVEARSDFDYDAEYGLDSKGLDEFAVEGEHDSAADGERYVAAEGQPDEPRIWAVDTAPAVRPTPMEAPRVEAPRVEEPRARARRWPILILVAVVVIAVSGGYGLASRDVGLPPLPGAPAWWATAGPHVPVVPIPDVPETLVTPRAAGATPPVSGDTVQADAGPQRADAGPRQAAVDAALAGVSRSYRALDAASLTRVWPGADVAALSQRFSTLKYQSLSFDRCDQRPVGAQVVASCEVSVAAAANAGDPSLERRQESWSIVLNRSGDRYVIGSVAVTAR